MKKNITIYCLLALATVLGLSACSSEDNINQVPEGMTQVQVRLSARYLGATRATGDWLSPTDSKEKIHKYWVAFVNSNNIVEELVHGDALGAEEHAFRFTLPPGAYRAFAFANLPEKTPFSSLFSIFYHVFPIISSFILQYFPIMCLDFQNWSSYPKEKLSAYC